MIPVYLTPAEATKIIDQTLPSTNPYRIAWNKLEDDDKEAYLREATTVIDSLRLRGTKADLAQTLAFPRDSQADVPDDVKTACALEACTVGAIGADVLKRNELQAMGIKSFTAGKISETYADNISVSRGGIDAFMNATAKHLLRKYLAGVVPIG